MVCALTPPGRSTAFAISDILEKIAKSTSASKKAPAKMAALVLCKVLANIHAFVMKILKEGLKIPFKNRIIIFLSYIIEHICSL